MDYFHLSEGQTGHFEHEQPGAGLPGDAVYEVMVRSWLCLQGKLTPGPCRSALTMWRPPARRLCWKSCCRFSTEETQVFKRGRNANPHSHPRGATPGYQVATGLEALFGWLYLRERPDGSMSCLR